MQRRKLFLIPLHAFTMVRKTLKCYALLSITIVMSFSLLLGYMLYTDSALYNRYKALFCEPRGMMRCYDTEMENKKLGMFLSKAALIGNTNSCVVYTIAGGETRTYYDIEEYDLAEGHALTLPNWQITALPDHAWLADAFGVRYDLDSITWLDGQEHSDITQAADEALLPEDLFYALGLDEMEVPEYTFRFEHIGSLTLKIIGLLKDAIPLQFDEELEIQNKDYINRVVVSQDLLNPETVPDVYMGRFVQIYTDSPELVAQLAHSMGYSVQSVYEQQNEALEQMRYEKSNKAVIAAALLLLLGINLYSSFSNALNDRKFEIGVKRAIGASAWSIVRQFLHESLIVMAANILISVALVADVFIVYKFIYERTPDEWGNFSQWTVYISPHSVAMFLVCSVTLTVVFSLVFAYKTTRVEIVRYLKAE